MREELLLRVAVYHGVLALAVVLPVLVIGLRRLQYSLSALLTIMLLAALALGFWLNAGDYRGLLLPLPAWIYSGIVLRMLVRKEKLVAGAALVEGLLFGACLALGAFGLVLLICSIGYFLA